tara:strand:+ start:360 stop:965 length:606 start_codon:yes stop_codon:yes gene_type:complete
MHKLNALIFGPLSFTSTLYELKIFLKFKPILNDLDDKPNVILFHSDVLRNDKQRDFIHKNNLIKICAGKRQDFSDNYDANLELPTSVREINSIVEKAFAKRKFNINSSITVKNYLLNKNEKKLFKLNDYILLTEKEVQLIQLFIDNKKPITKDEILSSVWNYSSDADTHTVETHIYRLRKKITEKFKDEMFILNGKDGYFL